MSSEEKKLQLMVPVELHQDLKTLAFITGTTVKEIVVDALNEALAGDYRLAEFKAGRVVVDTVSSYPTKMEEK